MSAFVKSSLPDNELRRYGALLAVSEAIASHRDLASLLQTLAQQLNQVVQCDLIKVVLYDADRNVMRLHSLQSSISADQPESLELTPEESPAGQVWLTQSPLLINNTAFANRFRATAGNAAPRFRHPGALRGGDKKLARACAGFNARLGLSGRE
jgi:transcriptional regulator with GAF, ATPase, and Fis domain